MLNRMLPLLAVIAVGVLFLVGLFMHGLGGGLLLLLTDAILVSVSYRSRDTIDSRGRAVRALVLVVVAVLAVIKLTGQG